MRSFTRIALFLLLLIAWYDATETPGKSIKSRTATALFAAREAKVCATEYQRGWREVLLNATLKAGKILVCG
ncbi:MAG: hypothetical protein HY231_23555 [Acidobacteria bacterium]|nr:hypothetical protein [Acidobacteriota bacterium]